MGEDSYNILDSIKKNKDSLDWMLEKQAELRSELMTFYKKDLKEIQSALSSINKEDEKSNAFAQKALEDVQTHFIQQWRKSYNLITPGDFENREDVSAESKQNSAATESPNAGK